MTYKFQRGDVEPSRAYPMEAIYRPEIPVWIGGVGERRRPFLALLDTGADDTKLPIWLADRLGVVLDREQPLMYRGIGGVVPGYFGDVVMELRQSPKSYCWKIKAAFLPDPVVAEAERRITISLGHTGFFRYFHAAFDFQRGRVKVRPNGLFVGLAR